MASQLGSLYTCILVLGVEDSLEKIETFPQKENPHSGHMRILQDRVVAGSFQSEKQ